MAAHRYWRLHVSRTGGDSNQVIIGELAMAVVPGGPSVCTGGAASADSSNNAANVAAKAFDGIAATGNYWNSASMPTGGSSWLQYDFAGTPRDIVEIRIYYPTDWPITWAPRNFGLYWSDDGLIWTRQRTWGDQVFALGGTNVYDATPIPSGSVLNRMLAGVGQSYKYDAGALAQATFAAVNRWGPFGVQRNSTRPLMASIFTGRYRIAGTTTALGIPAARRVDLLDQRSALLVESRNTGADGIYAFEEIANGVYTLMGVDNSAEQNSVVYAHVTPVPY